MGNINLPQKNESGNTVDVAAKVFEKIVKDKRIQKAGEALAKSMSEGIDKLFCVKR